MISLKIKLPDGREEHGTYPEGICAEDILKSLKIKPEHRILACRINNTYKRLRHRIMDDSTVVMCDLRDNYANMSYQQSLSLLYVKAVHDILGKNTEAVIANSLSKGLFTTIRTASVSEEQVKKIEDRMHELVKMDLPISEQKLERDEAIAYLKKNGPKVDLNLVMSAYDLSNLYLCSLDGETDFEKDHLLPSTGYLDLFELRKYRNGVLLRFPYFVAPDTVPAYAEQKLLYEAFSEENKWDRLLGISYASDLNRAVKSGESRDTILLSEALHEKKIADIAGMIMKSGKRIILIAGPSSSGKTSFAKRLCIQLRVIGLHPLYLGTDDYFINRADVKPGPDGKVDLEALSAVDTGLFAEQMNQLLSGKKADLPEYDFLKGQKIFGNRITSIEASQPIVIEGIHGLNPKMTEGIPEEEKFRIYISPLTQLNIDAHHRIPTTDARMLRRMVRDYRTRGNSAASTIDTWPQVRSGEEKNIFPYNEEADVFFNSQCTYELAVLKKYAEPLLKDISIEMPEYPEAQRMLKFLQFFIPILDDSLIPNNSIIREFIGGSVLVD
jgi:uridine kinase